MGRPLEIAIAGCGPAGLSAALLLHRDGHRVTLFERFETPQPVGSGLMIQPTGLAVLEALGLGDQLLGCGARIDRLLGRAAPSGRIALNVRYAALGTSGGFGVGVHRASLFRILHEAVTGEGITIETGRTVAGSEPVGNRRRLLFEAGAVAGPFDLVIDALGFNSNLAPRVGRSLAYGALWASLDWPAGAGFDAHALEQRYRAASVMAGVLPIGLVAGRSRPQTAFFWSLRADRLEAWRTAGLTAWRTEVLALWPEVGPLLDQIADPEQLTFSRYAHRLLPSPIGPALVHVGDSWHSASPQLGQGANMALLDSFALALALRSAPDLEAALKLHVRLRGRHIAIYQALSALFTPVYQSDSRFLPWLRDQVVAPLAWLWPAPQIQAAMVTGQIGGPLRPLGLSPATSLLTTAVE